MKLEEPDADGNRPNITRFRPRSQERTRLEEPIVRRVRLLRAALWPVYPHSMDFWLDGFEREVAPEREIGWWEHVTACFLEFEQLMPAAENERGKLFWVITQLAGGTRPETLEPLGAFANREKIVETMLALLRSNGPIVDMRET
jgi:hypothetical protein